MATAAGPNEQAIAGKWNSLRSEIQQMYSKVTELDMELSEHRLVITALEPMDPSRRCYRAIGGVLVERTVAEVLPAVERNKEGLGEVGWKKILNTPALHLGEGQTQYEYLETLDERLVGAAKKCHRTFLERLDWTKADNPDLQFAIAREESRAPRRQFYKAKAVHDLRCVQFRQPGSAPVRPDLMETPIFEPPDQEEFFDTLKSTFRMAATNFLSDLEKFRAQSKESLTKLATRFEETSGPLLSNKQISARHLALYICTHLPSHIRKRATAMMDKIDTRRYEAVPPLPGVNKDELLKIAQRCEAWLLKSESDHRAAGVNTRPRDTEEHKHTPLPVREHKSLEDRLHRNVHDRLEPPMLPLKDRTCHSCGKMGHLARNCRMGPITLPSPPPGKPTGMRRDDLAAHKTDGAVCTACKKVGHMEPQCWSTHPELLPNDLLKKKGALAAITRRSRHKPYEKVSTYTSPDYDF